MRVLTRSVSSHVVLAAALTVASTWTLAAAPQDPGAAHVIVRAVTGDGQPVLDLKPGEVTVRVDGRQREVKTLNLVRPAAAAATSAGPPAAPAPAPALPAPYAINHAAAPAPRGGREFLILVDDEGIGTGREAPVREAISKLVASLTPADRVGLMALKQGGLSVMPSARHAAVLEALPKLIATGSSSETAINLACRTKVMLGSVAGLLRDAPPERTIVLFSAGMAQVTADQMRTRGSQASADSSLCQIRSNDLEELGRTASGSAAEMFVVYDTESMASANARDAQVGLENVAGTTGAEMIRVGGNPQAAAERIARAAGFYYLLTLDEAADSGPVRRVDARTSREGLRVSARPVPRAETAAGGKPATPRDMIRVATVFRDVPVRAAGFISRQPGTNDLKVVALFEPDDAAVKLSAAMVGLFDEKGTLKAQWTAQPNELGRAPVIAALTVAPGKYRMRVAANDSGGNAGTTDYDLVVQLPDAAPVKTSTMLLGVGQGGFAPKLAFTSSDAAAIGFIELYNVAKDAKVETTFEILKADGEVMGSGQGTVASGAGEDARIAYGGFGIATLEPGDYTMRATISVDGKQAGVATRTLRKLR